jgi:tRNA nucleotidyltransferase/poly(A) polymerase
MDFIPSASEYDLFVLFKQNYASVFGGYIRDTYLGVQPHDIDVVVGSKYFDSLSSELEKFGYKIEKSKSDLFCLFSSR